MIFRGKHSVVRVVGDKAIKRFHPHLELNFWKEARFLTQLQPYDFVPRVYRIDPDNLEIEMEFIKGDLIKDFLLKYDAASIKQVLIKCFEICHLLDELKIQKEEMNHPDKHIIVSSLKPYFIDFERAHESSKPSNVTQFATYVTSSKIRKILKDKINIPEKNVILPIMKEYKKTYSRERFVELVNCLFEELNKQKS